MAVFSVSEAVTAEGWNGKTGFQIKCDRRAKRHGALKSTVQPLTPESKKPPWVLILVFYLVFVDWKKFTEFS